MTEFENAMNSLKDKDLDVQINPGENGWTVIEILRHYHNLENRSFPWGNFISRDCE